MTVSALKQQRDGVAADIKAIHRSVAEAIDDVSRELRRRIDAAKARKTEKPAGPRGSKPGLKAVR